MKTGVPETATKTPFETKDVLDTVNSVSWFFMDACWMLGESAIGLFMILPTVVTGVLLLVSEKRPTVFWINVAINCWIVMNSLWMVSDTLKAPALMMHAKSVFALGLLSIGIASYRSGSVRETFSHFRRFRVFKIRA